MKDERQAIAMTAFYAAGLLALVTGGLNLWMIVDDQRDPLQAQHLVTPVAMILMCVAYRWGLATGDRAILQTRAAGIAGIAIGFGLLGLAIFLLVQTIRQLAGS